MISLPENPAIGVLMSGGLDSSILLGKLLREGELVQPFYVQSGLHWQRGELPAVRRFLRAMRRPELEKLVVLDLPLADLYVDHWSRTGRHVPDARSADEAVYLPGRNALLVVKAAVWCQMHGIRRLALAPLGTSPFEDASQAFFDDFQSAINRGCPRSVELLRPFGKMNKRQVMKLGFDLPLELTFSCIAPKRGQHCGQCNKCAERQVAFREAKLADPTRYAVAAQAPSP
jgi:7-cyano-7-deazaguanine synthase